MKPFIVATGKGSLISKDGGLVTATPFVGATSKEGYCLFGVGIRFEELGEVHICGSRVPLLLLRSWRAMKILERFLERAIFDDDTVQACWVAGAQVGSEGDDWRLLDKLAQQFGEGFNALRSEILLSVPDPRELEAMLETLLQEGIHVDPGEIQKEVSSGRIRVFTPLLQKLLQDPKSEKVSEPL